jgi:hypothetical protein
MRIKFPDREVFVMSTEPVVAPSSEASAESKFFCFVQTKACAGKALKATEAFVPSVVWMFWVVRNTDVDQSFPLTEDEIRPHVRCAFHSFGRLSEVYNKENAITQIYPLHKTLSLMTRWREEQEHKMVRAMERKIRRVCINLGEPKPLTLVSAKPKNYGTYVEKTKKKGKPDGQKKNKQQNKGGKKRG